MNERALAALAGQPPGSFQPPPHDVQIGRYRGWDPTRHPGGGGQPQVWASMNDLTGVLQLSRARVIQLRKDPAAQFPPPVACIQATQPAKTGGWDGNVYGWDLDTVRAWAVRTDRRRPRPQTGRRWGSGDYTSLPRCGRPKSDSVHGRNEPCQAVRRKVAGTWAPACGIHLTPGERETLNRLKVQAATLRTQPAPVCGHPRTTKRGKGLPCQLDTVRISTGWAPACQHHLTGQESHTLGIT